MNGSLCYHCRV